MSNFPSDASESNDRFTDLLVQHCTAGLDESEQQELSLLESSTENRDAREQFELTAAAFDLSFGHVVEEMPQQLHDRLLVSAGKILADSAKTSGPVEGAALQSSSSQDAAKVEPVRTKTNRVSGPNWREIIAILVTAACLFLLLSGVNPFTPSAKSMLAKLEKSPPADLLSYQWSPVHYAGVDGRVVWSDARQEGYMVFTGLAVNDPDKEQYQLWIFDTDPAQKVPVDGGVFDVPSDGEVVIPIKAHVPVDKAVKFAVTIEKPGGVMQSKQEKVPVAAVPEEES